jgi:hypothetical protein
LQSSPEMPPVLSKAEFEAKINRVARQYSRMRKSEKLMDADALDYMVHSSWAEMTSDWRNAVIFWLERLTTREMALGELHPDCYAYFEGVWLDDVKEHRAYFRWLGVRAEEYWTPPHLRDRHYFIACEELRDDLINEGVKERTSSFPEAKAYIRQKCLAEGGGFSLQKCGDLIARKEKRIRGSVASARTVAETFTKNYYEWIIPAVEDRDCEAIEKVLIALRDGGQRAKRASHREWLRAASRSAVPRQGSRGGDLEVGQGRKERDSVMGSLTLGIGRIAGAARLKPAPRQTRISG